MKYSVGQAIVFMQESGGGIVREVLPKGIVVVEDEDGFRRPFSIRDIAPVTNSRVKAISSDDLLLESIGLAPVKKEKKTITTLVDWEIDLHIEELVESHANWSNAQILQRQLAAFKAFFRKACVHRIAKIVVIHGVGEGVLKSEIASFLEKETGVIFYDADFRRYGLGATAVEIFHTKR